MPSTSRQCPQDLSRAVVCARSGSKVVIVLGDGLPRARSNAAGRIVAASRKAGAASILLVSPAAGGPGLGGILGAFRVAADTSTSGDARFSRPENQVPLQPLKFRTVCHCFNKRNDRILPGC